MKLKQGIMLLISLFSFSVAHAQLKEGEDYIKLEKTITQNHSNKIEVLEFFAYFCPHCEHLEPVILESSQKWASDTYLRKEHVVWKDDDLQLARIASAVNSSGLVNQAGPAVFKALFTDQINLMNPQIFEQWATSQKFGKQLLHAYHLPTNMADAQRMKKLTLANKISSVPLIIVGGRYQLVLSNNYQESMKKLDELIDKVRKEKGIKTSEKKIEQQAEGMKVALKAIK